MAKRSRKKQIRRMEQKAQETRDRFERKAADARSSFGGTRRTIEALRTSSDVQFQEARTTAARLQKSALQARILLQVHDELVFEVPESELDSFQKMVVSHMEHAMELAVPLKVDVGVGASWYDCKN